MSEASLFEADVGLSTSTSYLEPERAVELAENFVPNEIKEQFEDIYPEPETNTELQRNLMYISSLVDASYTWLGDKVDAEQNLAWPRSSVPTNGNYNTQSTPTYIDEDTIPFEIELGTFLLLVSYSKQDRIVNPTTSEFKSLRLEGVVQLEWQEALPAALGTIPSEADLYLRKYGTRIPSTADGRISQIRIRELIRG